ncbi:hypothetical protein K502DRAFT_348360 [Neoconidiobolus thromboides FSU 785]|nr:hypothetical protein K502DRAFT_348360 [Neoconidiobolus thromboides FSU 785]
MKFFSTIFLLFLSVTISSAKLPVDNVISSSEVNNNDIKIKDTKFKMDDRMRNHFRNIMINRSSGLEFTDNLKRVTEADKKGVGTSYIGKKLIQEGGSQTDPSIEIVFRTDLPKPNRIITPNTPFVTLDYIEDRLNVIVDKDFIITKTYYG